jgi:hypothetical protein
MEDNFSNRIPPRQSEEAAAGAIRGEGTEFSCSATHPVHSVADGDEFLLRDAETGSENASGFVERVTSRDKNGNGSTVGRASPEGGLS